MAGTATEWEIPRCPEWRDHSMRGTEAFPKHDLRSIVSRPQFTPARSKN